MDRLQRQRPAHCASRRAVLAAGLVLDWDHCDTADRAIVAMAMLHAATSSAQTNACAPSSRAIGDPFPHRQPPFVPPNAQLRLSSMAMSEKTPPTSLIAQLNALLPQCMQNDALHIERKMRQKRRLSSGLERLVKRAQSSSELLEKRRPRAGASYRPLCRLPDDGQKSYRPLRQSVVLSPEKRGRAKRRSCPKGASKRAVAYAVRSPLRSLAALQPCRSRAA